MDAMEFGENETKQINVLLDLSDENFVKDWSVTAWGTQHEVQVRHSEASKTTDHLPQYTD